MNFLRAVGKVAAGFGAVGLIAGIAMYLLGGPGTDVNPLVVAAEVACVGLISPLGWFLIFGCM